MCILQKNAHHGVINVLSPIMAHLNDSINDNLNGNPPKTNSIQFHSTGYLLQAVSVF